MNDSEKMQNLRTQLLTLGIPVGYAMFPDESEAVMPYIVFTTGKSVNFYADGSIYETALPVTVILCCSDVDFVKEAALETVLDSMGILYEKERNYADRDYFYATAYTFEM